jgi:putative phosphoesterase
MKIGVISDSHDRIDHLHLAIKLFQKNNIDTMIHCGDYCAPFMIRELASFKGDIHIVFGNINDRHLTTKICIEEHVYLHGDFAELELDNRKLAVIHYPNVAEALALSGEYDAVFYGHTHKAECREVDDCLLINPGELMGRFGSISCAIYDTKANSVEFCTLKRDPMS